MQYANTTAGRQPPSMTGERATCPMCGNTVIAKCGTVYMKHWAHEADECDPWNEPETPWHRTWKERFPVAHQEIVMGPHRADVKSATGWILEFQNSPLKPAEIAERETFYGPHMLWVLNGHGWVAKNFHFRRTTKHGLTMVNRTPVTFRWKWPRKRWLAAQRPLFLDLDGETLVRVAWFSSDTPCGGWGTLTSAQALVEWAETGRPIERLRAPAADPLTAILERQEKAIEPRDFDFDRYQEWSDRP
jgi:hypothetical protein